MVLALVVNFNWGVRQLNISNAFLHWFLKDEIYMEQPQEFIDSLNPDFVYKLHKSLKDDINMEQPQEFFDSLNPDFVYRLHKSLYGIKQAPRTWFTRLSNALLNLGFSSLRVDNSLFTYHHGYIHIFLLIYVEDIVITGNSENQISWLIDKL